MSLFDPDLKSPHWNRANMTNDLKTVSACVLKCFCVMLTYLLSITPPMQVFGQGAQLVGDLINRDPVRVIEHFCNPEEGLDTPEPLVRAKVLHELCDFTVGDVRSLLFRLMTLAWDPVIQEKKIFMLALTYSNGAVGHCVVCLVTESADLICGCEPENLANVCSLVAYVVPDDIRQTLDRYGTRLTQPERLTLNGDLS